MNYDSWLPAVNWHLTEICNFQCKYCYATFSDLPVKPQISVEEGCRLLSSLAAAKVDKITFVGGEPTLHPYLTDWVRFSKAQGMVTALVTNGARIVKTGGHPALEFLDWCGLSLDSASGKTQTAMGRRIADPVAFASRFAEIIRATPAIPKLNSVVTRLNVREDLSPLVRALNPARWKIFQYLPMEEERYDASLMVTGEEFHAFVARHARVCATGVMEWEDNDRMIGSYVMIDPLGRFFDARKDEHGRIFHSYSLPILEAGVLPTLQTLNYDLEALKRRGGLYEWRKPKS